MSKAPLDAGEKRVPGALGGGRALPHPPLHRRWGLASPTPGSWKGGPDSGRGSCPAAPSGSWLTLSSPPPARLQNKAVPREDPHSLDIKAGAPLLHACSPSCPSHWGLGKLRPRGRHGSCGVAERAGSPPAAARCPGQSPPLHSTSARAGFWPRPTGEPPPQPPSAFAARAWVYCWLPGQKYA